MTSEGEDAHRRRRRRRAPGDAAPAAPEPAADRPRETKPQRSPRQTQSSRDSGERGLRDLVGAGRSQLGVSGALRGRDVNRPTDADLADAEANVVIVRRHWTPPPDSGKPTDAR
jgi:hypothetical protein